MTRHQRLCYNRGCEALVGAYATLNSVVVVGWQPHRLLDEVHNLLQEAAESLLEMEPNQLAVRLRGKVSAMSSLREDTMDDEQMPDDEEILDEDVDPGYIIGDPGDEDDDDDV